MIGFGHKKTAKTAKKKNMREYCKNGRISRASFAIAKSKLNFVVRTS
jgi:hypothetical protein